MTHRGRHRRRRRGAALRAVLAGTALALTATATLISASQATVTDDPGKLERSSATTSLTLREHTVSAATLDRLSGAMGGTVGVGAVLRDADRTLRRGAACSDDDRDSLPVSPAATRAYCWDPADTGSGWRAGSVTTSGDAGTDGRWGTHRVILAGWSRAFGPAAGRGLARVAVVDADRASRPRYRWVSLVVPVDGGRDYRGLVSSVSGMVWHRNSLLVTARAGGADALYVYDLDRIQRATVDSPVVGRVPGGWSAGGSGYVMPAVGSYRFTGGPCGASGPPCPGTLSLDRGTYPGSLTVAEWTAPGSERRARLWRYAFGAPAARGGPLAAGADGRVDAVAAFRTRASGIRGVLSYRRPGAAEPSLYVGRASHDGDGHGGLWRQDTRGAQGAHCGADGSRHCWAASPGSLSYWQQTGEVWSLSDRMLFAVPLASLDGSVG